MMMMMVMTQHYNINQKEAGTQDDLGKDGGTNCSLRIKEQETRLTLEEHDDDDDDDDDVDDDDDSFIINHPNILFFFFVFE